jgi:hypothetical protein
MTRDVRRTLCAAALALGVMAAAGCGATDAYEPAAVNTDALDGPGLTRLLPSEPAMESLLGLPLDVTTEATDDSRRIAYYRPTSRAAGAPEAGGYVSLALYATEHAAVKALKGNLNYKEHRKVETDKGVLEVFSLTDLADAGNGLVYREGGDPPGHHTIGIARIGRIVLEVVLFHGTGEDRIAAIREVVQRLRGRLPRG